MPTTRRSRAVVPNRALLATGVPAPTASGRQLRVAAVGAVSCRTRSAAVRRARPARPLVEAHCASGGSRCAARSVSSWTSRRQEPAWCSCRHGRGQTCWRIARAAGVGVRPGQPRPRRGLAHARHSQSTRSRTTRERSIAESWLLLVLRPIPAVATCALCASWPVLERANGAYRQSLDRELQDARTHTTGPDGELCDHLVVMRSMPSERRLSTLVAQRTQGRRRSAACAGPAYGRLPHPVRHVSGDQPGGKPDGAAGLVGGRSRPSRSRPPPRSPARACAGGCCAGTASTNLPATFAYRPGDNRGQRWAVLPISPNGFP